MNIEVTLNKNCQNDISRCNHRCNDIMSPKYLLTYCIDSLVLYLALFSFSHMTNVYVSCYFVVQRIKAGIFVLQTSFRSPKCY